LKRIASEKGMWEMQKKNGVKHTVDLNMYDCSCLDYVLNGGKPCKHLYYVSIRHLREKGVVVFEKSPDDITRKVINLFWPKLSTIRSTHVITNPKAAADKKAQKRVMKPARGFSRSPSRMIALSLQKKREKAREKARQRQLEAEEEADDEEMEDEVMGGPELLGGAHGEDGTPIQNRRRSLNESTSSTPLVESTDASPTSTTPVRKRRRSTPRKDTFFNKVRRISLGSQYDVDDEVNIHHGGNYVGRGRITHIGPGTTWHFVEIPATYAVVAILGRKMFSSNFHFPREVVRIALIGLKWSSMTL